MSAPARERAPLTKLQRAAVLLLPMAARLLYATWRVRTVNDSGWQMLRRAGRPYIFTLWHGCMLAGLMRHRGERIAVVVSEHRDGELAARIARRLGFPTVRGSTTRGAARALLEMSAVLEGGTPLGVTPDGPRGPALRFQPGALVAAARARAPVVPIGVAASSAWRLPSWDGFLIPKPFARVAIAYGDPWQVDAADARAAAALTGTAERAMGAVARMAAREARGGSGRAPDGGGVTRRA